VVVVGETLGDSQSSLTNPCLAALTLGV
jgi:hypothetical protein